ncbi:MAG: mechanosensitive ion channel domain-containing protein [Verrucomicrobiota bacterium]
MFLKPLPCLIVITFLAGIVHGQLPAPVPMQAKKTPAAEESEQTKIAKLLKDSRAAVEGYTGEDGDGAVPEGISAAEKEAYVRTLEETLLVGGRTLKNLAAIAEAKKELEEAKDSAADWQGFGTKPPTSLLEVDDLENERDAVAAGLVSRRSALANFQSLLPSALDEAKLAKQREEAAFLSLGDASDGQAVEAKRWRLEAAKSAARLAAVSVQMLQKRVESDEFRVAAAESDQRLLDRKISVARRTARFTEQDLARVANSAEDRKEECRKASHGLSDRLKKAIAERTKLQRESGDSADAAGPLVKARLEAVAEKVELLESMRDSLEGMVDLQESWVKANRDRFVLLSAKDEPNKRKALQSLQSLVQRLKAWDRVISDELGSVQADLAKLSSPAVARPEDDAHRGIAAARRGMLTERLESLQQTAGMLASVRKPVVRWVAEFSADDSTIAARFSGAGMEAWNGIKTLWSFEIASFDTKMVVGGEEIVGKRPLTIGMVIRAVVFFALAYWVAVMIADKLQSRLVRRGRLVEAHARTLRNWVMIVVSLMLAFTTLSILKIPLAVFAFFGGALAIGLGFGTQNLIKNFISGIIVLVERKVRVGDILTVGDVSGTVVEVNARSSVIRSADDVETMIPNAMFLENEVTNQTLTNSYSRKMLRVRVDYENKPQTVCDIMKQVAEGHGKVMKDPEPFVTLDDVSDGALVFMLYFWFDLRGSGNSNIVLSDLRHMIFKRFEEAGVTMPRSQRELMWADFSATPGVDDILPPQRKEPWP